MTRLGEMINRLLDYRRTQRRWDEIRGSILSPRFGLFTIIIFVVNLFKVQYSFSMNTEKSTN